MNSVTDTTHPPQRSFHSSSRSTGGLIALLAVAGLAVAVIAWGVGTYNSLVSADQDVQSKWAQVENAYQRRADLVPNLVETVKGAANFEQKTFTQVTEARARVGQMSPQDLRHVLDDPAAFKQYEAAQQGLGASLQRLLVVSENYPTLKATENFRDLQSQLEGTENRIAVERMRFNEAARGFNTLRNRFPGVIIARSFGAKFADRPYFEATPAAQTAPSVRF